jgi:DNA recombination protein RmuC
LDENFAQNLKSVKEVNEKLGHIQSTANKMIESTKSVDKLNQIFARTSSKAFGDFGEKYLESLLSKHLEENSWAKQVKPPGSSDKIDFVIYLADKKIGIDAKFPVTRYQDYLEAEPEQQKTKLKEYLRGVMQMAYDISHKYYKESFLDNLFLYVPSEGMYSEIVKSPEVMDYLQQMKVTLTSPNTVFPLIMVVQSYQFKAKVSQNAESIISGLKSISQNVQGFREEFRKLGDKIRQSQQNYDKAESNLLGVERQVMLLESGHSAEQVSGDSQESNQADTLM